MDNSNVFDIVIITILSLQFIMLLIFLRIALVFLDILKSTSFSHKLWLKQISNNVLLLHEEKEDKKVDPHKRKKDQPMFP